MYNTSTDRSQLLKATVTNIIKIRKDIINDKELGYIKKQIGDEFQELNLSDMPNYTLCGDYLVKGNWKYAQFRESFIEKIKNNPNPITKITFPVKEFLENDEEYFLKNTNRPQYL